MKNYYPPRICKAARVKSTRNIRGSCEYYKVPFVAIRLGLDIYAHLNKFFFLRICFLQNFIPKINIIYLAQEEQWLFYSSVSKQSSSVQNKDANMATNPTMVIRRNQKDMVEGKVLLPVVSAHIRNMIHLHRPKNQEIFLM